MDKFIYGGDTETYRGRPLTLQFYSEDTACDVLEFVNASTAAKRFLAWCGTRKRNVQHVVYVHNLAFDLLEFLWGHHAKLNGAGGEFDFNVGRWHIRGVYGAPTFCRISDGHDRSIMLVDSFSFFRGSLEKGAELFCPDLPKLRRPKKLGEVEYTARDRDFCKYARRDAVVAYHIGSAIEALHREYDLRQCVSVADLAARIFRHKYLTYTIPQPSREVNEIALGSYHGGKNNITCEPGWYEGVTALDISSAYPHAMASFPAFSNARLYRRYTARGKVREVPEYGVYRVSGELAECQWPVIFSAGFKPLSGRIVDVPVQGFELNEALRSRELRATKIRGFMYDAERDHQAPALRNFVDEFYRLKSTATDKVLLEMYKLILNSISGKFIQTRKRGGCAFTDVDSGTTVSASELIAGGMFHPFIASATTAHTRARIHRLEHHYKAIHTATDGILSQLPFRFARTSRDFDLHPQKQSRLGALTIEAEDATYCILRNKCYIGYTSRGKKTTPSRVFRGKHIRKFALHGFQGNVTELERLVAQNRRVYYASRPVRLKESLKAKPAGIANEFIKRRYTLKVPPLRVHTPKRRRGAK